MGLDLLRRCPAWLHRRRVRPADRRRPPGRITAARPRRRVWLGRAWLGRAWLGVQRLGGALLGVMPGVTPLKTDGLVVGSGPWPISLRCMVTFCSPVPPSWMSS
jgi:hypothetical protein